MSIVVIDNVAERKIAVELALKRAGWLLEKTNANAHNLLHFRSKYSIAINLNKDNNLNSTGVQIDREFKNSFVIGPDCYQSKTDCIEYLTLNTDDFPLMENLIATLLEKVADIHYRHIFPITENNRMKSILLTAKKAASSQVPIMILGETGSGKEVIARYIHQHSKCVKGPFVAMNCAAVPETMIEAALFGYERGSFTNAISSHTGKFEKADNGTLFLDELGEMSLEMQAKLLRVLQTNEFERIGGKDTIRVNVRIIAATNNDLTAKIANGLFRTDLYYRLNVININCLSLRDRIEDIEPIANYFVQLYSQDLEKDCVVSGSVINKLKEHTWPGNVRELQNVLHRAVILNESGILTAEDIRIDDLVNRPVIDVKERKILKATEADAIVKVLKESNGCRTIAARILNISPRSLRYKISRLREIGFDVP